MHPWWGTTRIESPLRITKAWTYCIILYLVGVGSATIVDHFVGNLDRSNLRLIYLILGVLLMLSSLLWLHVLREGVEKSRAEKTLLALSVRHDSAIYPNSVPIGLSSWPGKTSCIGVAGESRLRIGDSTSR